jgi:hypothetical protein
LQLVIFNLDKTFPVIRDFAATNRESIISLESFYPADGLFTGALPMPCGDELYAQQVYQFQHIIAMLY